MVNPSEQVAKVVLEHSECAEVFQRHRIDFCCRGDMSIEQAASEPKAPKTQGATPLFSVNNIQLQGGGIIFDDRPMHEKHEIRDVNLSLPFVSNMAYALDVFVEPAFSAVINGAVIRASGKSKPFADSLESELSPPLGPGVRLATMHRMKGLEFPCVVIAGFSEGYVPMKLGGEAHGDDASQEDHLKSERCLAHVAATRARDELLVTNQDHAEQNPNYA